MEHMCARCARLFLVQRSRRPPPRLAAIRLRPFSSVSPRFAKGPIDLSQSHGSEAKPSKPKPTPTSSKQRSRPPAATRKPVTQASASRGSRPVAESTNKKRSSGMKENAEDAEAPAGEPSGSILPLIVPAPAQAQTEQVRNGEESTESPPEKNAQAVLEDDDDDDEDEDDEEFEIDDPESGLEEIEISDEENALLDQLTDENIDKLSEEQLAEVAGRLDLVDAEGNIRDPGQYPYSRMDWPEEKALRLAQAARIEEGLVDDADEDLSGDEQADRFIDEVIDPPDLPMTPLPYFPQETSTAELREDWPNTPLSAFGLTESVIQKVSWLAKRLPHGYWTPGQIAERFDEGYMVRFASEEEKQTVLALAAELANARAAKQAETSGEEAVPATIGFKSLVEGDRGAEATGLVEGMAQGKYETPAKQSRPLLDSVVKQLDNNDTYAGEDRKKFVDRVENLIKSISVNRGAGAQKK